MSAANLIAHISRLDGVSPYQVRCYSFGNFSAREMFAFVLAARFPKIFVFSRIGRATLCGADEPLSPGQLIEHALVWPIVRPHNQACTDRICQNIFPFLVVIFLAAQAMMKPARLKSRRICAAQTSKPAFPKTDPVLDLTTFICGRAKHMDMIGHD